MAAYGLDFHHLWFPKGTMDSTTMLKRPHILKDDTFHTTIRADTCDSRNCHLPDSGMGSSPFTRRYWGNPG